MLWRLYERWRGRLPPYVGALELPGPVLDHFRRRGLRDAWETLPRGDWVIEVLVRARVEPSALDEVVALLREAGAGWTARVDWGALARREDGPLEATLHPLLCAYAAVAEAEPEVVAARAVIREVRPRSREVALVELDRYDRCYARVQAELADRLRARIPFEVVERALGARARRSAYR